MPSIAYGVARPTFLAGLAAFIAAAFATATVPHCPWGFHCEDGETAYMNLLQVKAESHNVAAPAADVSVAHNFAVIQQTHPYYHTSEEIHNEAKLLSKGCGGVLTMETLGEGSNVSIDVVRVRAKHSTPVNKVFILFGEHSRELISPESGLRMLQLICGKVALESHLEVPSILQDSEFLLVLNGNPSSRRKVEGGDYCLRTNPNGVDLNRNWEEGWQNQEASGSQTNPGPQPFSEVETQMFKKLAEDFQPTTFLTVHSGTKGMYMPWAYDMKHAASFNSENMLKLLQKLDKTHCQCPFGAAGHEVGYPCPGTCLDWVYSKLKTPYVFAFEIYTSPDQDEELKRRWNDKVKNGGMKLMQTGSHLGHQHFSAIFDTFASDFVHTRASEAARLSNNDECFAMFNPDSEERYNSTVQNWAVAYLEMAASIATDLKKDARPLHLMKGKKNNDKTRPL